MLAYVCANQTLKLHSFGFYVLLGILNPNLIFHGLSQGLASAGGALVCQSEAGEASFSTAPVSARVSAGGWPQSTAHPTHLQS